MERGAYDEMRAIEDHHWWFRAKRRLIAPLLREAVSATRARALLDVGCGTGSNLAHAARLLPALAIIGLDFDQGALRYCRERGLGARLVRGDGTRLPISDGHLDLIVALDIIEHFEDDEALLAEFHRTLRAGGQLVASVPAYPWLWSPHDEFLHHKRRYRSGELERKLVRAGFALERRHGFNFLLLPPIALVRLARRALAPGERGSGAQGGSDFFTLPVWLEVPLNACMSALFALESLLVRILPIRFGVSLMLRARRA